MATDATRPTPPRISHRARAFLVLGALATLLAGLAAYYFFRDEPPQDDSDLRYSSPASDADKNGLAQLRAIHPSRLDFTRFLAIRLGLSASMADNIVYGKADDDALVEDFLAQAQPDLEKIDRILGLPDFIFDLEVTPVLSTPEATVLFNLVSVTRLAARHYLKQGDYHAAVDAVLRARRLAARATEGPVPGNVFITAMTLDHAAILWGARLLNTSALPPAELARLQEKWGRERWLKALQAAINIEYEYDLAVMDARFSNPKTLTGIIQTPADSAPDFWVLLTVRENSTRRKVASYLRLTRDALGKNFADIDWLPLRAPFGSLHKAPDYGDYLSPNFGGKLFAVDALDAWPFLLETAFLHTASERLLEAGLAARRYYDDHHALPVKLDDLVPQYISAVPIDPFDGKPLRYDANRGLIYSVGTSLKDNGGSKTSALANGRDDPKLFDASQPTLEMTFQNPPAPTSPPAAP